jgi:hypothetical protein
LSAPSRIFPDGTFFAIATTVGSLLVLFLGDLNKTEKAIAMPFLTISAPVTLAALFQIQ